MEVTQVVQVEEEAATVVAVAVIPGDLQETHPPRAQPVVRTEVGRLTRHPHQVVAAEAAVEPMILTTTNCRVAKRTRLSAIRGDWYGPTVPGEQNTRKLTN